MILCTYLLFTLDTQIDILVFISLHPPLPARPAHGSTMKYMLLIGGVVVRI